MLNYINSIILIIMLLFSSFCDVKYKKIPNILTLPVMLWGLLSNTIISGFKGFQFSIFGLLFGIGIFILPFAWYLIGGGDVKLMGVVGALMGWKFSLSAVLYSGIAGGIIAIIITVFHKDFFHLLNKITIPIFRPILNFFYKRTGKETLLKKLHTIDEVRLDKTKKYIPYGVAITVGTLLVLSGVVPEILK